MNNKIVETKNDKAPLRLSEEGFTTRGDPPIFQASKFLIVIVFPLAITCCCDHNDIFVPSRTVKSYEQVKVVTSESVSG